MFEGREELGLPVVVQPAGCIASNIDCKGDVVLHLDRIRYGGRAPDRRQVQFCPSEGSRVARDGVTTLTRALLPRQPGAGGALRMTRAAVAPELTTHTHTALVMRNAPPAPWLPVKAHGSPVIMLIACHSGPLARAELDLAPIRAHGRPIADSIQVKDYVALQSMFDAMQPAGLHYYWKSEFLSSLDDDLLDACQAQADGNSSPTNQILLFHLAGELNTHRPDDGAIGNRDASYACIIQASWPPSTRRRRLADMGSQSVDGDPASLHRRQLRELPDRRRDGRTYARLLRRQLPAAPGPQVEVRPLKPLPREPQHPSVPVILGLTGRAWLSDQSPVGAKSALGVVRRKGLTLRDQPQESGVARR